MSNLELGFFLVGGLLMLGLTLWSTRTRDLESRGNARIPFFFGLQAALLFAVLAGRSWVRLAEMSDLQQLVAAVIAGAFSATAILMFARAYHIGKARA